MAPEIEAPLEQGSLGCPGLTAALRLPWVLGWALSNGLEPGFEGTEFTCKVIPGNHQGCGK